MLSETATLEFHYKTQKLRYEWHVIRNYHPRISLKYKKSGTDGMLLETTTLEFH